LVDGDVPAIIADRLRLPVQDVAAHEEQESCVWERIACLAGVWAPVRWPLGPLDDSHAYRALAERTIRELAQAGAVVLGRAAAIVLRDSPEALHVRLDGPAQARVAQAVELGGLDRRTARRQQRHVDRMREHYVRHYYHTEITNPRHFDLLLDATSLPLATCAEIIVAGARHLGELRQAGLSVHRLRQVG
jgi:hypothetical protein